jgi:hypothetical protein
VAEDYFKNKILRTINAIIGVKEGKPVKKNNIRTILCGSGHATVPNKKIRFKTLSQEGIMSI